MADYTSDLVRTASATLAIGSLEAPAASMRRIKLYEFVWGYSGTPADAAAELEIQRSTATGTATTVTPLAVDPADAACVALTKENHSVQGTLTAGAFVYRVAMNQRSTFRWVAREGKELIIPATASNGFSFNTPTTPTVAVSMQVAFTE